MYTIYSDEACIESEIKEKWDIFPTLLPKPDIKIPKSYSIYSDLGMIREYKVGLVVEVKELSDMVVDNLINIKNIL